MGAKAAIVPLTIAAAPFVAKVVADAIRDVDEGIVEASRAMGATRTMFMRSTGRLRGEVRSGPGVKDFGFERKSFAIASPQSSPGSDRAAADSSRSGAPLRPEP